MFLRRWLSLVAILGVLVHAGLFVCHNAMMLGAALDSAALAEALGEICQGQPGSSQSVDQTLPQNPDGVRHRCPDCLGAAAVNVVLPAAPAFYLTICSIDSDTRISAALVASADVALWPPGQGPPLRA
jgi:hypothetical protein